MNHIYKKHNSYFFFVGTEAEFIKVFPVLRTFETRMIPYTLVFSGQNDLSTSQIFEYIHKQKADVILSTKVIPQTSIGLLVWCIKTTILSCFRFWKLRVHGKQNYMIVHGDTVSTVMGAIIGKLSRMKIAHLESGLRSFSIRQPFPEEIDRLIVSRLSDMQFCPNEWAINNVRTRSAKLINTKENTLIESLMYALESEPKLPIKLPSKYYLFVLHRQENLMNKKLVTYLIRDFLLEENMDCIFLMHAYTKQMLEKYGLMHAIRKQKRVIVVERMSYASFMQVIKKSEFVITDGGSNQEECYYMGVPTLLLRNVTERIEGLGMNVVISKQDIRTIESFIDNYNSYRRAPIKISAKPSEIITDYLVKEA